MPHSCRFTKSATIRRWCVFNSVGLIGVAMQLATLAALHRGAGLHYLASTALAVEAAVLHNFFWHEHWTWADRAGRTRRQWPARLLRFNLTNGMISILSNVFLMKLLVAGLDLNYLLANLLSITLCSIANFIASDRYVFRGVKPGMPAEEKTMRKHAGRTLFLRRILSPALCLICISAAAQSAELKPGTVQAWDEYIRLTQRRIDSELQLSGGFLACEFLSGEEPSRIKTHLHGGEILVRQMETRRLDDSAVSIPSGMVHHWLGDVFIPKANLDEILAHAKRTGAKDQRQEDVLESRVVEREGDSMRIYLRLTRSRIVTVTYNTEHLVRYRKLDDTRASSQSVSLHIAELEHANTAREREKPEGADRGFLWRLNSYWRYQQVPGGVIIECESVSLSRGIPMGLGPLVRPIINKVARESMCRTLSAMRDRFSSALNAGLQNRVNIAPLPRVVPETQVLDFGGLQHYNSIVIERLKRELP